MLVVISCTRKQLTVIYHDYSRHKFEVRTIKRVWHGLETLQNTVHTLNFSFAGVYEIYLVREQPKRGLAPLCD